MWPAQPAGAQSAPGVSRARTREILYVFRISFILWPYLRALVVFTAGVALLSAAAFQWQPLLVLPGFVATFWWSLVLALVAVVGLLWPELRLIADCKLGHRLSTRDLLLAVAITTFAFVLGTVPEYVGNLVSPLRHLYSLDFLPTHPAARYYQVRELRLDTLHPGLRYVAGRPEEGNPRKRLELFAVCPVLTERDTVPTGLVWLGHHYEIKTGVGTRPDADAGFISRSERKFARTEIQPFYYLAQCLDEDWYAQFRRATTLSPRYQASAGPPVVLLPVYEPFAERTHHAAQVLGLAEAIGNGLFVLLLLVLPLDAERQQQVLQGRPDRSVAWALDYLQPFQPRRGYLVTPLLLDANLLVFALMAYGTGGGFGGFSGAVLLAWGASYGPAIAGGEWWRLLSGTFLHGSFSHLANNMVLLAILGGQLERVLGSLRVAVVYLACGGAASLLSYWWHPEVIGVGASGALFGWMGLGLTLFWRPQVDAGLKAVLLLVVFVSGALSLVIGFLSPNVDNAAHLGGLTAGVVLGYLLWPWLRSGLKEESAENSR